MLTPRNYWKMKLKAQKERVEQVKAVRTAYELGNDAGERYNAGLLDGMELAIAIYEDRKPNLQISTKK